MSSGNLTEKQKALALYNLLYGLLDNASYWEIDLDENGNMTISLKTKGVIKLLTQFGYLQESDTLQILDVMKREAGDVQALTALSPALTAKDTALQHALFERMYWHHVKTGKKRVEHLDYGRVAFLETDPRIVVTKEERQEVIRQVQIEYVLQGLKNSSGIEPLISQMEQIDRNTANNLYGKMYSVLQQTGRVRGYDYFGGREAAFKKQGEFRKERTAAIDALALELRAEWFPTEAR